MAKIVFIEHSGKEHVIEAVAGKSVMESAVENLVPGIIGDCGGACSCATCHCYVDPGWTDKVDPKNETEEMMLDGVMNTETNSRLSCQIKVTSELDGLVVRLPASQF